MSNENTPKVTPEQLQARADELQKRIQEQLKLLNTGLIAAATPLSIPHHQQHHHQQHHHTEKIATSATTAAPDAQRKYFLDERGNLVDERGTLVPMPSKPVVTSLANLKRQRMDAKPRAPLKLERAPRQMDSQFFDRSMGVPKKQRANQLQFHEPGTLIREAKRLRSIAEHEQRAAEQLQEQLQLQQQQKLQSQQQKLQSQQQKLHSQQESQLLQQKLESGSQPQPLSQNEIVESDERMMEPEIGKKKKSSLVHERNTESHLMLGSGAASGLEIPESAEWWDIPLLPSGNYADLGNTGDDAWRAKLLQVGSGYAVVEHPAVDALPDAPPESVYLTKRERKKIRTQTCIQREREKQQKIRLGLLAPPPPRANLKNFMRVHLSDGTMDPTRLEKLIREQIAERIANHEARNQERKLSRDQRLRKRVKKYSVDAQRELMVCAFRVGDASHPQNRFKLRSKAQEYCMTGCVLSCGQVNIIIAEGGPAAMRKYIARVMRINWRVPLVLQLEQNDEDALKSVAETNRARESNRCELMWRGSAKLRSFRFFRFRDFEDENTAKKYLQANGYLHLWDMAKSKTVLHHVDDDGQEDSSTDEEEVDEGDENTRQHDEDNDQGNSHSNNNNNHKVESAGPNSDEQVSTE